MEKEQGFMVLVDVVKENKTHQDYKRVTDLADKYFKLVTGNGIDKLLHKIITRESDEEFKQRMEITKSVVPAILNSTKLPFQKATRKQPIVRKIEFAGESETKEDELEQYIQTYWGDKSLEKYLEYAFVDYNYTDPNAFLITEFDAFDPIIEHAQPYPFVATSTEAVMFEYKNEILEYLVVKLPIKYLEKGFPQDGFKYTMYLGMDTIELTQVSHEERNNPELTVIEIEKKFYSLIYFEPLNEKVPAIRFGFVRDTETKGRTFVSVFHSVMAYLEKTLKIDSELDLSTAMVAFPQRFAYVSPCQNPKCNQGNLLDGSGVCPDCNGTGKQPFHRGTQDIITLALPQKISDTTNSELVDLEKLLVYKSPPIELLTFQQEYIEYLKKSVHAMMFNADLFTRDVVSVTATEKILETDNMNDTLYPFARHYSSIWEFTVKDIATFTDNAGVTVQHKFPNDFKMKGLGELMTELKMAKDAAASTSTISAIEDDINEILYSDRPDELKEIKVKNEINPFRGYSEADIRFIISQGNIPLYSRTLWENFEVIFQDVEVENPELFDMAFVKINEMVKAKTLEYMKVIKDETPEEPPLTPFQ
jgi:hypothetical protein